MPENYAHALIRLAEKTSPKEATASVAALLKKNGREKLLPRVLFAVARMHEKIATAPQSVLTVAKEEDRAQAEKESGLDNPLVRVDPTLVGGWHAVRNHLYTNRSYKSYLKDIYNRARA